MAEKNLPDYYNTVMPYLIIKNVPAFISFTKNVFDAEEMMSHSDENGEIVHAEIKIGDSTIMAGESSNSWGVQTAGLYINVESADKYYNRALKGGATTVLELSDKEYGRACGVKDPCGNTWWITSQIKKGS